MAGLAIAVLGIGACLPAPADPPVEARPNLILISLDTTRADALSCYGTPPDMPADPSRVVSPTIDALAAEGLRFERFYTHAPTTLNAHTSMLSGLDPHGHAVPRNGFPVPSDVQTLTQRLSASGYDTIGVVGAKALEQSMGLDRGFRIYDDTTTTKLGPMYQDRAEGVTDRALQHLETHDGEAPLFLFVHYYDPHTPYRAPPPFRFRYSDPDYDGPFKGTVNSVGPLKKALKEGTARPEDRQQQAALYLGEVAYADHHLGRLLEALGEAGHLDHALVVVTADHGEVLAEIPTFAYGHGSDVSEGVTRIPLVIRGYGVPLRTGVVESQAAMVGLAPTLELALGMESTLGDADHFFDLIRPGPVHDRDGWPARPTRTVFMEATRPRKREFKKGWNNLNFSRGIHAGGYRVTSSKVYRTPPQIDGPEALKPVLVDMLERWDAGSPTHQTEELADETRAALEALGYLD